MKSWVHHIGEQVDDIVD